MRTVTVVINFQDWVKDEQIVDFFVQHDISGTRASMLNKKYAVEVPAGQEEKFAQIFKGEELVKKVYETKKANPNRPTVV